MNRKQGCKLEKFIGHLLLIRAFEGIVNCMNREIMNMCLQYKALYTSCEASRFTMHVFRFKHLFTSTAFLFEDLRCLFFIFRLIII